MLYAASDRSFRKRVQYKSFGQDRTISQGTEVVFPGQYLVG